MKRLREIAPLTWSGQDDLLGELRHVEDGKDR
jgi:hypothetical protein